MLLCPVLGHITGLFLDVADEFKACRSIEGVTCLNEKSLHVFSEGAASDFHFLDGMRELVALEDRYSVCDAITAVANETGSPTS